MLKKARILSLLIIFAFTQHTLANNAVTDNYELAAKAFAENKPNDAFIHLKNALQENPRHIPSKLLMSKVYFDAGNLPAVEEELEESLALGADVNLVLPILGSAYIAQRKVNELMALEKYRKQFTTATEFEWALLQGQVALIRKDEAMAQFHFEEALATKPRDVRGLTTLARLYIQTGWLDKADALIKKALDIDHKNEKTWALKAELALVNGKPEAALDDLNQAFLIDSYDPKILRLLSLTHLQLGHVDDAQKYVDLILAQSPSDPAATLLNAWMLMAKNDTDLAQQSLAELSNKLSLLDDKKLSEDSSISFIQGASEYIQGNYEKARNFLEIYLTKSPKDLSAIKMLSEVYVKVGLPERAIDLLEANAAIVREDLKLSSALVELYIHSNKYLQAEQIIRQLQTKKPDHPYLTYLQAQIEKARRRPEVALALLQKHDLGKNEPLPYKLLRGELALQLNDISSAVIIVEEIIASGETGKPAYNFIAATFIKNGQPDKALPYINKVIALDGNDINALFNKAIVYKSQDKFEEAQVILNGILKASPQHTPSRLLLGRNELKNGHFDQALSEANKILLYDANNTAALELKLATYNTQEQWSDALSIAIQLNQLDRLNPNYLVENIRILTILKRYSDTTRFLDVLSSLWSESPDKLLFLAKLQSDANQTERSIQTLKKIQELDKDSLDTQLQLAKRYLHLQDEKSAADIIKKVEVRFGTSVETLLLKANIAQFNDNLMDAQQMYLSVLNQDKTNTEALLNLYQLSLKGIAPKQFTQHVELLVKAPEAPPWVRKLLADSYLQQNEWENAKPHYETLLQTQAMSNDPGILNNLAFIYAKNDLNKGLVTARKALALSPKNPSILDTTGWILAQMEKYNDALPYLRDAYSVNASNPETRYHIGYTLLKLGRKSEAMAELNAAVSHGNVFSEYKDAKALLDSIR